MAGSGMAGSRRLAGVGSGAGSMTVTSWARGGRHPLCDGQQVPAGDDAGRPRVVDDVQDLRVREPGVDRHDRAARQLAGQVDEQGVGPVAQQR
ncbi:MAG TPA: hypothetical protein VIE45_01075, partial [Streptosporangiaceae bacterium]